jgi:AraC-like DNA-binding protein
MSREGISWSRLRSDDERILAATRLLNRLPLEAGFPGKALIQESHLSLVQLNRLFLLEFGLTSRKYWDKRRLQQALDTLQEADTPIKEIAYNLGFRSDSLFINWFRRRTGQSPGKHRELNHISRTV